MLTIFGAPKPFRGHIGVIQRNAIRSWTLLHPECKVILLGNEDGIAETAAEFGCQHIPDVARNAFGTPLVSDVFARAQRASAHNIFCYANSDIILMSDFVKAIERVVDERRRFLLVGHRWNCDIKEPLDFGRGWEDVVRARVREHGTMAFHWSIDFFAFPRGLFQEIPPFALGRPRWDNWMLYRARSLRIPLVDATDVVMAVHQNHDYAHHPQGQEGVRLGEEAWINDELAGGDVSKFVLSDATHMLTRRGLRLTYDPRHLLRHCETFPILHPWLPLRLVAKAVHMSRPFRSRFGLTVGAMLTRSER